MCATAQRWRKTTVGITVFFDEGLDESSILAIGDQIQAREEVERVTYTSAQEAWETFKTKYFEDMEELAAGFADDNPLADSASYEIFLKDISLQEEFVAYLTSIDGVRKVNYSKFGSCGSGKISIRSSAFCQPQSSESCWR